MSSSLTFHFQLLVSAMVCTAAVMQQTVEAYLRCLCWTGESWQGTIPASPSAYASSYQREAEMFDTGKQ